MKLVSTLFLLFSIIFTGFTASARNRSFSGVYQRVGVCPELGQVVINNVGFCLVTRDAAIRSFIKGLNDGEFISFEGVMAWARGIEVREIPGAD